MHKIVHSPLKKKARLKAPRDRVSIFLSMVYTDHYKNPYQSGYLKKLTR